ncbi:MAG: C39 family peptidase [Deltaproteobacteria bacterium]|nr:C39 family peptidase [Deltaproteobacteria bacterium]
MKLKVPYFRQENETHCGVACIRMVLSFYGLGVSEFELADECETGWLGNTCGELVQGVIKYDFEAKELENVTHDYLVSLIESNSPLIVLLDPAVLYGGIEGFGHFVVITGCEGNRIWYNDPDLDRDLMRDADEFFRAWESFSFKGVRIWKSTKK